MEAVGLSGSHPPYPISTDYGPAFASDWDIEVPPDTDWDITISFQMPH